MKILGIPVYEYAIKKIPSGLLLPSILMETGALCVAASAVISPVPFTLFGIISWILLALWCASLSKTVFVSIAMNRKVMFSTPIRVPVALFTFFLFSDTMVMIFRPSSYSVMCILADLLMLAGFYGTAAIVHSAVEIKQ